ncbi:MAG: N-acetyl-alpha-D-glucosaminyl L-malate synthase BshA [Melioribacteraceae bacterium]|nr:N-acetyl-alpha-D-glucosaminyl L-malate synthase BshA [Melioribacteraceae bacterium]
MKIGITCYPTYGGSGVIATELGKALADKGHEIHFISYSLPQRLNGFVGNIFFHEVEMSKYPLFENQIYGITLTGKTLEVIEYANLDILHVHYALPHAVSGYLTKQILKKNNKDIKLITTLHGTDITLVGLEPAFLPLVKFSIEESDGVTTVSEYLKQRTIENYGVKNEIEVIPNFIDLNEFKPEEVGCCKKSIAPAGEKILVHVSNFRKVKRIKDTIKIVNKLKDEIPVKLLLIGDGPERSDCEKLARDLGLIKEVLFMGKQSEIKNILSVSDLFLLPSKEESFGLSALEAMSCGVPVISSNIGGIPEVNIHGETGFLSEVGDINDMANNCKKLLLNENLRKRFSNNCLVRAKVHFDKNIIVPQYENYYERVLSK